MSAHPSWCRPTTRLPAPRRSCSRHPLRPAPQTASACSRSPATARPRPSPTVDRKSTRLNSSHRCISYAVFCLEKKDLEPFVLEHNQIVAGDYAWLIELRAKLGDSNFLHGFMPGNLPLPPIALGSLA